MKSISQYQSTMQYCTLTPRKQGGGWEDENALF